MEISLENLHVVEGLQKLYNICGLSVYETYLVQKERIWEQFYPAV